MASDGKKEGLTKRFDGEGTNPSKDYDYERSRRWCRAYLTMQKVKGVSLEAHGSLVFALPDGTPGTRCYSDGQDQGGRR